ncbi:MAG TPA: peptidylprolyl isomerase [Planctomycetota bacterium]|nr:peptidylprolyl isomerase [Planctomycetota bacterium]
MKPEPGSAKPGAAGATKTPVAQIDDFIAASKIDRKRDGWKTRLPQPPRLTFDGKSYFWKLDTNKGEIKVKLLPKVAPMHVSSTIYLTQLGFYDGLKFHRVIQGFMAQGGCPLGSGTGGPGYDYDGEFDPKTRHDKPGLLSMANAGPGTDGSQFFLTFVPTPHLDDNHTIFGEVVAGMETVKSLEAAGSRGGAPKEPLQITKATIIVE